MCCTKNADERHKPFIRIFSRPRRIEPLMQDSRLSSLESAFRNQRLQWRTRARFFLRTQAFRQHGLVADLADGDGRFDGEFGWNTEFNACLFLVETGHAVGM